MKTNANKPRKMRALTAALALTVLGLTVSATISYTKCDRYANTSGDPSNCGEWSDCPGYCQRFSYSANCGMCVYTGDSGDSCNDVTPYYITENTMHIVCIPTGLYTAKCECPDDDDDSWFVFSTQRKVCNCN